MNNLTDSVTFVQVLVLWPIAAMLVATAFHWLKTKDRDTDRDSDCDN